MADNEWTQPDAPPPPLFLGEKERDFVKQINDELIERIIGQGIFYYPISMEQQTFTHFTAGNRKNILTSVRVYALVMWEVLRHRQQIRYRP